MPTNTDTNVQPALTNLHVRANTHSTFLTAVGCKCIKNTVWDARQTEKTASWHRWHRAKIQLITANTRPLPRRAAKTTNMSSRPEHDSKDYRQEWVRTKRKVQWRERGDKKNKGRNKRAGQIHSEDLRIRERENVKRVIRVWLNLKGCVGLEPSSKPLLKVAKDQCLSLLHSNDGTGSNTHTRAHCAASNSLVF